MTPGVIWVGNAFEQPVVDEARETVSEHCLRDVEVSLQITEATHSEEGVTEDQQRPAFPHNLERSCQSAVLIGVFLTKHATSVAKGVQ